MKIREYIALLLLLAILCAAFSGTQAEQLTGSEGPMDYQLSFPRARRRRGICPWNRCSGTPMR